MSKKEQPEKAAKPTKSQMEHRVHTVYELLLFDTPRFEIVQYAAKTWTIKTRAADNLIKRANDLMVKEAAKLRENMLEKHLTQRAFIRHKAFKEGDKRLAFDILKDETKLFDLYPATKQKAQVSYNVDVSELSNEQLERIIKGEDPEVVFSAPNDTSKSANGSAE